VQLKIEGKRKIKNPSESQIREALQQLGSDDCTFAILDLDNESFMQSSGSIEQGFIVEYCESNSKGILQSLKHDITLERVVDAFVGFRNNDTGWSTGLEFSPLLQDRRQPKSITSWVGLIGVAIIIALFFITKPLTKQETLYWFDALAVSMVFAVWDDFKQWKNLNFRTRRFAVVAVMMLAFAVLITIAGAFH
jgi:hypothetical protein